MRVILVNPPHGGAPAAPLGLAYLAAVLETGQVDVSIVDMPILGMDQRAFGKLLAARKPDMVGITCMTVNYHKALGLASLAKTTLPDVTVVMGGPHVTFKAGSTLRESTSVDVVVRQEGEYAMLEIAHALQNGRPTLRDIRGITYRDRKGKVVENPKRPLIQDLDSIPFPACQLLPLREYKRKDAISYGPVLTSRGCPYMCAFCSTAAMQDRMFRGHTPGRVANEVELMESRGFHRICFVDDNFTFDRRRVSGICKEMIHRNLNITWACSSRVDHLDRELCTLMSRAGCEGLFVGFESGCQQTLDAMGKGTTVEQGRRAAGFAKESGIELIGSFIIGFPGETLDMARQTIRFCKEIDPNQASFNFLIPYPGTRLHRNMRRYGVKLETSPEHLSDMRVSMPAISTREMSRREMAQVLLEAYAALREKLGSPDFTQ